MTQQAALFYEDYYAALRDDVGALGGAKTVAVWFWPEKDPLAARNKLNDTLNPDRREHLTDEQERMIMRRVREVRGYSAALAFICDDTGFDRPHPIEPADEVAGLQRAFIESVQMQRAIADRIERLTKTPLAAVR